MVLAAMLKESIIKKAWEEGFKQGFEEGRRRGLEEGRRRVREERLKRWDEAYAKFGVEVNGVLMLPLTPEVEQFLWGKPEE